MPHPHRLDFHGAIHLVHIRGRGGNPPAFFAPDLLSRPSSTWWSGAPHVRAFQQVLTEALEECACNLLGYRIEADEAILLLQTAAVPLQGIMQRLCGAYARHWRRSVTRGAGTVAKGPFAGRYDAKVIAPEYLPHALRRVHAVDRHVLKTGHSGLYPFSSAQAYSGAPSRVVVARDAVLDELERKGRGGAQGYRDFMRQSESPYVTALLDHGSPLDALIVGNRAFVQRAHDAAAHPPPSPTRERLIAAVAARLNHRPELVLAGPQADVLARSMVAWHALRTGAASLTEVGRWCAVSGATVARAMRHHRQRTPQWFDNTLAGLMDEPDTKI